MDDRSVFKGRRFVRIAKKNGRYEQAQRNTEHSARLFSDADRTNLFHRYVSQRRTRWSSQNTKLLYKSPNAVLKVFRPNVVLKFFQHPRRKQFQLKRNTIMHFL